MPVHTVTTQQDIERLRESVHRSATEAVAALRSVLTKPSAIDVLAAMKFSAIGRHPLAERRLNLIEQMNQTFTYLVSLAAAGWVVRQHPSWAPLRLNLGTSRGTDLESAKAGFAAEAFAAVRRTNNGKLRKDLLKVSKTRARRKYVFFYAPGEAPRSFTHEDFRGVTIVALSAEEIWGGPRARS